MILFLNKMDSLKEKVEGGKFKIEDYFPEFSTYKPPPDASGEHWNIGCPLNDCKQSTEKKEIGDSEILIKAKFFFRDQFLVSVHLSLPTLPFVL